MMASKFSLPGNGSFRHKFLSLLASILLLFSEAVTPARASVNFVRINALWDGNQVRIQWETSAEVDNSEFYIHRSLQQNGTYTIINEDPIYSTADDQGGATYEYIDFDINSNTVYWYMIEAWANDGEQQFSDPVPAGPGVGPTPTRTATPPVVGATPTSTTAGSSYPAPGTEDPNALNTSTPASYPGPGASSSPLPTSSAPTLRTSTPTATLPGLQPTLTQAPGSTPSPGSILPTAPQEGTGITTTSNLTVTATLIPLPPLKLIFPEPTEVALLVTATPESPPPSPWSTPRRLVPLGLVVMIWVILGAWFYYSQRNIT